MKGRIFEVSCCISKENFFDRNLEKFRNLRILIFAESSLRIWRTCLFRKLNSLKLFPPALLCFKQRIWALFIFENSKSWIESFFPLDFRKFFQIFEIIFILGLKRNLNPVFFLQNQLKEPKNSQSLFPLYRLFWNGIDHEKYFKYNFFPWQNFFGQFLLWMKKFRENFFFFCSVQSEKSERLFSFKSGISGHFKGFQILWI